MCRKSGADSSVPAEAPGPARKWRENAGRGSTTLLPRFELPGPEPRAQSHGLPRLALAQALREADVLFVGGKCGVGKSTRVPLGLLDELDDAKEVPQDAGGIAHCIPTNTAAHTIYGFYEKQGGAVAKMACRWHGASQESHVPPRSRKFVALCTPASLCHLFQRASAWDDIRFLILDEVHKKMGLLMLFVHYFAYLRERRDRRVQRVKLLLLTATKEPGDCVVDAIERRLSEAGLQIREFSVPRDPGRPAYTVANLWHEGKMEKPVRWDNAHMPERACMAAEAMASHLWDKWESAQILFVLPGEKEVCDVRNALNTWEFGFDWELYVCQGDTPRQETRAMLKRLEQQRFHHRWPAVFLLCTAGVSEDSWTIWVNGVVDSGLQVVVDDHGFLHVGPEDDISATQREGRAGRVADGVYCRLMEQPSEPRSLRLPYPEALQVRLASASLGIPWPPPAMEATTHPFVQDDLIRMGLVARAAQGHLCTTSLGEEVLLGHMDVALNLLVAVAARLGIRDIGVVAAAFLTSKRDLFSDVLQAGTAFGLDSRQDALGESAGFPRSAGEGDREPAGDVHTAVRWYLEWVRRGRQLPSELGLLFRTACFRKMEERAPAFTTGQAEDLLASLRWRRPLTVALAFAFQRNIVHRFGARYKTTCYADDPIRQSLNLPPEETILEISNRSVCFAHDDDAAAAAWVVYAGTARFPFMKAVTPLPANVAGWFAHTPFAWDLEGVTSVALTASMSRALNSDEPQTLQAFLKLLLGPSGEDTGDNAQQRDDAGAQRASGLAESDAGGAQSSSERPHADSEAEAALALAAHDGSTATADTDLEGQACAAVVSARARRTAWRRRSALLQQLRGRLREGWSTRPSDTEANADADAGDEQCSPRAAAGHDVFDADDFLGLVRRMQTICPAYHSDAEALAQEIACDDKYTVINVVMEAAEDLQTTLELFLLPEGMSREAAEAAGAEEYFKTKRQIRRQIKNYVFFLRARALRRWGPWARGRVALAIAEAARDAEPLLSWQGQSRLLDHALSAFSAASGSRKGAGLTSSEGGCARDCPDIVAAARAAVGRMQSHAGTQQIAAKKRKRPVKDQLKKAKQRLNWSARAMEWVLFEDVLMEAREYAKTTAYGEAPETRANRMWENDCYGLELFTVEGRQATQAEAFEVWARQGYSSNECKRHWPAGATRVEGGACREVDPTWKEERTAVLMASRGLPEPAASSATPTAPKLAHWSP